jgi:hypothetical protein
MRVRPFIFVAAVAAVLMPLPTGLTTPTTTARADGVSSAQVWCSQPGHLVPCVLSATRDAGSGPVSVEYGDPTWDVYTAASSSEGGTYVDWSVYNVANIDDSFDLGDAAVSDTWTIALDLGNRIPRRAFARGDGMTFTRQQQPDGTWHVTIAGHPARMTSSDPHSATDADCRTDTWPWSCRAKAFTERVFFSGGFGDQGQWYPVSQRASFFGMNTFSNIEVVDDPQAKRNQLTDQLELVVYLANPHYLSDGVTLAKGFLHMQLPRGFLKTMFGIDDPATVTTSGVKVTYVAANGTVSTSGTMSIRIDPKTRDVLIDATGITFSAKAMHVKRGVIVPTRPGHLYGKRTGVHRARLYFTKSRARGARLTGYTARCSAYRSVVTVNGAASPILVTGLRAGVAYTCKVRARSTAGPSAWSLSAKVPRRP